MPTNLQILTIIRIHDKIHLTLIPVIFAELVFISLCVSEQSEEENVFNSIPKDRREWELPPNSVNTIQCILLDTAHFKYIFGHVYFSYYVKLIQYLKKNQIQTSPASALKSNRKQT